MTTATLSWDGQSFTATPEGFRWQRPGGEVLEGPWSQVASVMAMVVTAKVSGAAVASWQHLGLSLLTGESFKTYTRDKAAFEVADVAVTYAAPFIIDRVLGELSAGQRVDFGAVSLSPDELTVKGTSYPLARVAGHRTAHGYWMFDVGEPAAPRLAAKLMLHEVPNHFALRAALAKLKPRAEYAESGPDLGSLLRPSASSHDPRYLSGRGRVLLLGGLVLAVAVVGGGILGAFEVSRQLHLRDLREARAETQQRLDAGLAVAKAHAAPDAAWSCAALPKAIDDVVVISEVPTGVKPPFREPQFVYSAEGAREVYPFENASHVLLAQVQRFETQEEGFALEANLALVRLDGGEVACAGWQRVLVPGKSYDREYKYPDVLLAEGLAHALCRADADDSACRRTRDVRPLAAPAPAAAAEAPPPTAAAAAPTYKKGMAVLAERKGQWLPAVLLKPVKGGWRVRFKAKKQEETVPPSRLRLP